MISSESSRPTRPHLHILCGVPHDELISYPCYAHVPQPSPKEQSVMVVTRLVSSSTSSAWAREISQCGGILAMLPHAAED